jgi:FixJ family two-component response regulator
VVLIDDDELVRLTWKMSAREHAQEFKSFGNIADFLQQRSQFDFSTLIYLDSNLGNGVKGEDVAHDLYSMGYRELYLATGYDPSSFGDLPWIKRIVGKDPPF